MTDSATEKRPTWKHPAWRVLAGLSVMQAGFTGITVNCMGVLLAAVIADMGYAASRMALFYTLRGLVSAALVVLERSSGSSIGAPGEWNTSE